MEWLSKCAENYNLTSSAVLEKLIDFVNSEPKDRKRIVFTQIRCGRCTQASTGGKKEAIILDILPEHLVWLNNVKDRCKHSSIDKTLRIMLDFYTVSLTVDNLRTFILS
eukprot:CFRG5782T1